MPTHSILRTPRLFGYVLLIVPLVLLSIHAHRVRVTAASPTQATPTPDTTIPQTTTTPGPTPTTDGTASSATSVYLPLIRSEEPTEGDAIYPPSPVIRDIVFHDDTARTEAPGSDNWPITWAANGQLYTTWGDGGGFGGTNSDGRVSLGTARIEGGPDNYQGFNIAGGIDGPCARPFGGKSVGILALDNTLYLWRNGDSSNVSAFKFSELHRSDDLGCTWQFTGVRFSRDDDDFPGSEGFFAPPFCNLVRATPPREMNSSTSMRPKFRTQITGTCSFRARSRCCARRAIRSSSSPRIASSPAWTRTTIRNGRQISPRGSRCGATRSTARTAWPSASIPVWGAIC